MTLKTDLLPHQVNAFYKLYDKKVGALYMEQGTGKTRTTLELIKYRLDTGRIDKVLWLCPCGVKVNLLQDIVKHTGDEHLETIRICGIETLSSSVRTNLELLEYVKTFRVMLVVDESNLIKNHRAKRTTNITRLAGFCAYRVILNGTPIGKNEADLYAQWYLLDKRILGYNSFYSFAANHCEFDEYTGKIRSCFNVDYLTRKIAPYTYQVKKSECLELPNKHRGIAYYSLDTDQYNHYDEVASALMMDLDEFESTTVYRLFAGLQNVISGLLVDVYAWPLKTTLMYDDPLSNPRIEALLDVIEGFKVDDKIIIWAKYTHEILSIAKVLNDKFGEGSAVTYYGALSQKKRQANIGRFTNESRFFIANKTCAGYGLNLQFCHSVIYYSTDWDYATRAQSEDRVHRIGQVNVVKIVDICARDTLDIKIAECLTKKEDILESFKAELKAKKDKTMDELLEIENIRKEERKKTYTEIVWEELSDNTEIMRGVV